MSEHKKAHKEIPKAPELKIRKLAKKGWNKFKERALPLALSTAIALSPFALGLSKGKPVFETKRAYAEEQQVIEAKEVLDAIENTKKLIKEGKVEEVKFNRAIAQEINIGGWKLEIARAPPSGSAVAVHNKLAKKGEKAPFITDSIWGLAERLGVVDHELVKGYIIQRPDDPSQTVLVLACKDHLDFYVLNEKKEIEWIPIILDKVGIERKPKMIIEYGESKRGGYIGTAIFDENFITNLKNGERTRLMIANIYPKPKYIRDENGEKLSKAAGGDILEIVFVNHSSR